MITFYYLAVAFVSLILSVLGKCSTLLIPAAISAAAMFLSIVADQCEKHSRIFNGFILLLGGGLVLFGLVSALLSPLPILDHLAVLTQGLCGLLVTVTEPIIEKLKAD